MYQCLTVLYFWYKNQIYCTKLEILKWYLIIDIIYWNLQYCWFTMRASDFTLCLHSVLQKSNSQLCLVLHWYQRNKHFEFLWLKSFSVLNLKHLSDVDQFLLRLLLYKLNEKLFLYFSNQREILKTTIIENWNIRIVYKLNVHGFIYLVSIIL